MHSVCYYTSDPIVASSVASGGAYKMAPPQCGCGYIRVGGRRCILRAAGACEQLDENRHNHTLEQSEKRTAETNNVSAMRVCDPISRTGVT